MSQFQTIDSQSQTIDGSGAAPASGCRPSDYVRPARAPAPQRRPASEPHPSGGEQSFPLVFCPEMPCGTRYELVRRQPDGTTVVLYDGLLEAEAPSLNLAKVRYRGARLGANWVVLVPPHPSMRFVSLEP